MTRETTPRIQRIYLKIGAVGGGMMRMSASLLPPAYDEPMLVLLSRGNLPIGQPISFLLVSDPSQDDDLRGPAGKDGTNGTNGTNGSNGTDGRNGTNGTNGVDGKNGSNGNDGLSAYQVARSLGYGGTATQWLTTLVGAAGKDGTSGTNGSNGTNGKDGLNATAMLGSVTLAETGLLSISAGVRRRVITTTFDLPVGAPLLLIPKSAPPLGYIVQAAWATKVRELTVDLTLPAITALSSYSFDNWLLRLN